MKQVYNPRKNIKISWTVCRRNHSVFKCEKFLHVSTQERFNYAVPYDLLVSSLFLYSTLLCKHFTPIIFFISLLFQHHLWFSNAINSLLGKTVGNAIQKFRTFFTVYWYKQLTYWYDWCIDANSHNLDSWTSNNIIFHFLFTGRAVRMLGAISIMCTLYVWM